MPRWSRPTRLTILGQGSATPRSHAASRSLRLLDGQRENRMCDSYVTPNRPILRSALQRLTSPERPPIQRRHRLLGPRCPCPSRNMTSQLLPDLRLARGHSGDGCRHHRSCVEPERPAKSEIAHRCEFPVDSIDVLVYRAGAFFCGLRGLGAREGRREWQDRGSKPSNAITCVTVAQWKGGT